MNFFFCLILYLSLPLLVCVTVLGIVLCLWRNHPIFKALMNFRRPMWLTLFISVGMIGLGFAGKVAVNPLIHLFHIENLGLLYLAGATILLLILTGGFLCLVASTWCLWSMTAAILSCVRSCQSRKVEQG
jgi:hypothetical protein